MTYDDALRRLEAAFAAPLPGPSAQWLMAPQPRRDWPAGFNPARVRRAAGLLLLFPIERRPHVILTLRANTLGRHRGQVSLPGGVLDPGETYQQAALREAQEEVGLDPGSVRVLGALTPLDIPVSGFRLHPIVAAAGKRPALSPADSEVERILEVAVEALIDPERLGRVERVRDGRALTIPLFSVADAEIWGATAMVLAEFLALLGWPGPAA